MPLHFNIRVSIERETFTDDVYGGAVSTGTILYANEPSRIDYYMPRQALISVPGLETSKAVTFFFHVNQQHPLAIQENDTVIITFPPHHPEFNKRFRLRGFSREATHPSDARGILEAYCERVEKSRGVDY